MTPPPPPPTTEKKVAKIAFLFSGPIDDLGWNAQHYAGLKYLQDQGHETHYTETVDPTQVEKVARDYINLGYNFIIYGGGWAREGFLAVSKAYPDSAHVLIEGTSEDWSSNTETILDQSQQTGYIEGVLAAKMSTSKVIGNVIGMEVPDINLWTAGIAAGVRDTDPTIKILYSVVGSFEDPAKGKEATLGMIEAGADVVIECGDGTSFGIVEAVKSKNVPTMSQWGGTADFPGSKDDKLLGALGVAEGYCNWAPAFASSVARFEDGTFGYRGYEPSFQNGLLKLNLNPAFSQYQSLVSDLSSKIKSGVIAVPYAKG
jgi:basic membrane lipoprotein Med (substrate-binding protein (PBP1-ABC) superfamily)